jgi:hypothetical protein
MNRQVWTQTKMFLVWLLAVGLWLLFSTVYMCLEFSDGVNSKPEKLQTCGMSPRTQTRMFLVWLLAVGVVAAIFYGLYVLGIFLWCQLEAGKVTDFCLTRRIAS